MIANFSTPDLLLLVEAYNNLLASLTMKALSQYGNKEIEKKRKRCLEVLHAANEELGKRNQQCEA